MKKIIWIICQYASTPETGISTRHYNLARELVKNDVEVYLIASASHHLLRNKPVFKGSFKKEFRDGFHFIWTNLPSYKNSFSKMRVLSWFIFGWRLLFIARIISKKPDTILYSSPSLIPFLGASILSKRFKAKLVCEVRDIWPLTLINLGGYSPKNPFIIFNQWIEDMAYRTSDKVISNLEYANVHMTSRGMRKDKFIFIPNGFSIDELSENEPLDKDIINRINTDKFIVGYTGTIGHANALDNFIKAAENLKMHPNILFILVGDGKEKDYLLQYVLKNKITNILFIDSIKKKQVQTMLSYFDICYQGVSDADIYSYGSASMKIPEYLFSGKPVIHAYSGKGGLVTKFNAGIEISSDNIDELVNAIIYFYKLPHEKRKKIGERGRQCIIEEYEYKKLSNRLLSII